MRNIKLYISAAFVCLASVGFIACDSDKDLTTDMPEVELMDEITIDNFKSATLFLGVGMDSTMQWTVKPVNLEDKGIIWKSSNEAVATVSQDGTISAKTIGEATISITPAIGFGATETVKAIPVKVLKEVVKATDIIFTNDETDVYQTATLPLSYNILPANHTYDYLTWKSSNEAIATVDENGVVRGIAAGVATITAYTHDRSKVKASIDITVKEAVSATEVAIALNQDFALYETHVLDFTLTPANATAATVKWESNDRTVASIDNEGNITTHKIGTVKITATTANGATAEGMITVAEGLFRKDFSDGTIFPWEVQNGATFSFEKGKMVVKFGNQNAEKYRGDFVYAASNAGIKKAALNVGTYRYFAVKMTAASNLEPNNNRYGCIAMDTNNGRYKQPTGNGNNNYSIYVKNGADWEWNKPAIYYYDMQQPFGNSDYRYSLTSPVEVTTFKFVMADYPKASSKDSYEVYWVRSFKTLEELKALVDNE